MLLTARQAIYFCIKQHIQMNNLYLIAQINKKYV